MSKNNKNIARNGFTLIELSIVMLIIALVLATSLSLGSARIAAEKIKQTRERLEVITANLKLYVTAGTQYVTNGIPCPADASLHPTNDASFGIAVSADGDDGNALGVMTGDLCDATPAGILTNVGTPNLFVGAVPTRTLNLPDEYAFDGWGRKFTYVVDQRYNQYQELNVDQNITIPMFDTISVRPSSGGADITTDAVVMIISHGANKHGAWERSGNRLDFGAAVGSNDEDENVFCGDGVNVPECDTDVQFLSRTNGNTYDDITRYLMRWQLVPPTGGVQLHATPECNRPDPTDPMTNAMTAFDSMNCPDTPKRCVPLGPAGDDMGTDKPGIYVADMTEFDKYNALIGADVESTLVDTAGEIMFLCVAPDGNYLICGSNAPGDRGTSITPAGANTQHNFDVTVDTNSCFWMQY